MPDLLEVAKAELASLDQQEREFRERIQRRKEELQMFLKTAVSLAPSNGALSQANNTGAGTAPMGVTSHGTKQSTIIAAVADILAAKSPLPTRFLLGELQNRRIEISGKEAADQVISLSSLLSRNKEIFVNDRANGWSLKKKNPESVSARSGSSQASLPA